MQTTDYDARLRAAASEYVRDLQDRQGGVVTEADLTEFRFEGKRISLLQPRRGIRVVAGLESALTIRTTFRLRPEDLPYEDGIGLDGYPRYKWRGADPNSSDNKALRQAMISGKPLIWFFGVAPKTFSAVNQVWAIAEEPENGQFVVSPAADLGAQWGQEFTHPADAALHRQYVDQVVARRLHQPMFRVRVLEAYARQCAVCRLRHPELLDAAHILEDSEGGEPIVPNGVAMCALHHRAFDSSVIGIRPDYIVEVRRDVLDEIDGPTLLYTLQGLHSVRLTLPAQDSAWPRTDLLEERYERFKAAS